MLLIFVGLLLFTTVVTAIEITCTFDAIDPNFGASISFLSPYPTNQSWHNITNDTLQIHITNELGETMNVSFYWANHTLIGYNNSATNDTDINISTGITYDRYVQYNWYVNVSSIHYDNQSAIYWFKGEAFPWDINRDQSVTNTDLSSLLAVYLEDTSSRNDINNDGTVNYLDRSMLQAHMGDDYT